jgi:hypothetical protein
MSWQFTPRNQSEKAPRPVRDTSPVLLLRHARIRRGGSVAGRVFPSDFSHHAIAILSSANALLTATARSLRTRAQS